LRLAGPFAVLVGAPRPLPAPLGLRPPATGTECGRGTRAAGHRGRANRRLGV